MVQGRVRPADAIAAIEQLIYTQRGPIGGAFLGIQIPHAAEYLGFLVAYGHARCGHRDRVRPLVTQLLARLERDAEPADAYLTRAFVERVDQAMHGLPPQAPLGDACAKIFGRTSTLHPSGLRGHSAILAPYEAADPWCASRCRPPWVPEPASEDERAAAIADALATRVADRVDQLHGVLDELFLLSPTSCAPLLSRVLTMVDGVPLPRQAELLAKIVAVAEHADRVDLAVRAIEALYAVLHHSKLPIPILGWILPVATRLQLRLELVELGLVADTLPESAVPYRLGGESHSCVRVLRAGYLAGLGDLEEALPVIASAREALCGPDARLHDNDARWYAVACSQLPAAQALPELLALTSRFATCDDEAAIRMIDAVVHGIVLVALAASAERRVPRPVPVERREARAARPVAIETTPRMPDRTRSPRSQDSARRLPFATALDALTDVVEHRNRTRCSPVEAPVALTRAYARFQLAYGYARLGLHDRARTLADHSCTVLAAHTGDPIHDYLGGVFVARIDAAIAGDIDGPLPSSLDDQLASLSPVDRYKVQRLREASTILEPHEDIASITAFSNRQKDARGYEVAALRELPLERRAHALACLLEVALADDADRARLLGGIIEIVGALPEPRAMLERATAAIARVTEAGRARLYANALEVAASRGVLGIVPDCIASLARSIPLLDGDVRRTIRRTVTSLVRLDRRADLGRLVDAFDARVPDDDTISRVALAGGFLALGEIARATPDLDRAREIADGRMTLTDRLELVRALALAWGHGPQHPALARIVEMQRFYGNLTDSFGTNSHFCLAVLDFVESIVLGIVALGEHPSTAT